MDAVLYDTTLEPQAVKLLELDGEAGRVVYVDAQGGRVEAGLDAVVRLRFAVREDTADPARPVLMTTDGQRAVGRAGQRLRPVLNDPESVAWRDVDDIGITGVSLDDLAWVTFDGAAGPASTPEDDVLLLANGEQLVGFVDALAVDAVHFVIGDAADPLPIAPARVSGLWMSNPNSAETKPGVYATMRSGSRVHCLLSELAFSDDGPSIGLAPTLQKDGPDGAFGPTYTRVLLGDAGEPLPVMPAVRQLDFGVAGRRLVPLSSLPMAMEEGGAFFGVPSQPLRLADGAVALHAPVAVSFALPEGARRLVATVALAIGEDIPVARHAWAGCEVVVRCGDEELARVSIDAEQPEHRLNLALPAAAGSAGLTVTVEEGVNGPILDRIELRDAEVLVVGG